MEQLYWIWLMSLKDIGNGMRRRLLAHFQTPEAIWQADAQAMEAVQGLKTEKIAYFQSNKDLILAKKAEDYMARHHIRLITIEDAVYPESLKMIPDPPVAFFAKGNLDLLNYPIKIGVVGSRKASPGGLAQSNRFAKALAEKGITIVSGFAMGIDAAAHEGALGEIGSTICVLGSGINVCYPTSNKQLYHDVLAQGGLIISEFFLDDSPMAFHFPLRNRIISGLSDGVLVVEAAAKSGALVTAKHALDQNKEVYVIPKDIMLVQSVGSNRLLKDGAKVVTEIKDILEDFVEVLPEQPMEPAPKKTVEKIKQVLKSTEQPVMKAEPPKKAAPIDLSPDERRILQWVSEGYDMKDQLVIRSGWEIQKINSTLTMLEFKDVVSVQFDKITLL